jgi:hypothetical protein
MTVIDAREVFERKKAEDMRVRMQATEGVTPQAASNTGWMGFFLVCLVVLAVTAKRSKG